MKRKAIITLLVVFAAAVSLFVVGINSAGTLVEAASVEFPENVIKDEYLFNEKLTLPDSITASCDGKDMKFTSGTLVYPDGTAYKKDSYILNEYGNYNVVYTLKSNNGIYKAEKTFSVKNKKFGVTSSSSSAEYGALTEAFSKNAGVENGIVIALASGDAFNYNVPIDLSKNNINDFITLYTPQTSNAADAGEIIVRLTDCYDSSTYVDFLLWFSPGQSVHARAGGVGQRDSGFSKNPRVSESGNPVYVDGEEWYVAFSNYGAIVSSGASSVMTSGVTWRYDAAGKKVFAKNAYGSFVRVTELANSDIYGNNLFGGFTTGEVYLSIFCENYYKSEVKIEISQIDGAKGDEIDKSNYVDKISPILNVKNVSESGILNVIKGKTVSIFEAEAIDVSGATVTTEVYYNYESSNRGNVFVRDGKFVAEQIGAYTIVYTATDRFGNKTVRNVTVNSVDVPSGKTIDFSVDEVENLKAGYETVLPEYSAEGLNGDVFVDVYAVIGNEKIKIENGKFIPMQVGTYEIVYEYGDDYDRYVYSYNVASTSSDAVIFSDELNLPRYFIKGAEYSVPEINAILFSGKETEESTDFFVKFDNGDYVKANAKSFVVTGTDTVSVKYSYGNRYIESAPIEIVDVGFTSNISISEYFQGDFTAEEYSNRVKYVSDVSKGNNSLEFINALSFDNFRLEFTIPSNAAYSSLEIKLSDYYDADNSVTVSLYAVTGAIGADVNDENYKLSGTFSDGSIKSVYYDNANRKIVLPGGTSVALENPFKSDLCYLNVEMKGLSAENAYVEIRKVNNQPFTRTYYDIIEPIITAKNVSGQHEKGEKIMLESAVYTDVLSPSLYGKLTIEVLDPQGRVVVSDEGIALDGTAFATMSYSFTPNSYGDYSVSYKTIDQSGNAGSLPFIIIVRDDKNPVVKINGDTTVKIKRSTEYNIDNYTVSDNLTKAENIEVAIVVVDYDNNSVVSVGNKFTAKYVGRYKVYVYCTDEAGNSDYASFTVIVE